MEGEIVLNKGLLNILACPKDHSPLVAADSHLISLVNRAIASGRLRNCAGRPVTQPIDGGLVRADGILLYPIVDGIPVMLVDEAILLEQVGWA
jgi:uncharacterized protein YbaR (Trm112 family)